MYLPKHDRGHNAAEILQRTYKQTDSLDVDKVANHPNYF